MTYDDRLGIIIRRHSASVLGEYYSVLLSTSTEVLSCHEIFLAPTIERE